MRDREIERKASLWKENERNGNKGKGKMKKRK